MADPVSLAINAALLAANMALTASQEFEGPRLDDLRVTTADYGTPLNYLKGVRRFDGCPCFWAEDLTEVKERHKTKGGKYNEYKYYGTWAVAVADCEVAEYLRIFFDRNLVYDATGAGPLSPFTELGDITRYMTFYYGTEDQDVDPRMAATVDAEFGEGSTPAYRGVAHIVFKDLPLEKLGNRFPQVSVIVATAGGDQFPYETFEGKPPGLPRLWGFAYSPDGGRFLSTEAGAYEIWDVAGRALMVEGDFPVSVLSHSEHCGIAVNGRIYVVASSGTAVYEFSPDGEQLYDTPMSGLGVGQSGCIVLKSGTDDDYTEWLCTYSASFFTVFYVHDLATGQTQTFDTLAQTGYAFTVSSFVRDAHGDIWAVGRHIGVFVTTDTVYFWRVVNYSGRGVTDFHACPVSAIASGGFVTCEATHFEDHFVVLYGVGDLHLIDDTTFAFISSVGGYSYDVDNVSEQFANLRWQAQTLWLGAYELDLSDGSILRTVNFQDWKVEDVDGSIYDPINHAIICAPQFADVVTWRYLDRVTGTGVTLRSIVEDVSERCGLDVSDDIDASDLTQTVTGYSWTQGTGKAILEPLLEAYDSEGRPHDWKVQFLRRGVAVGGSIPVADMGAGGETRYAAPTVTDTDLPLKVSMTFADVDKDQQPNTALAQRPGSAVDSRREVSLDASTIALDADGARPIVDRFLRHQWMKAQTFELSLTRQYSALEPGDALTLILDDVEKAAKLTRLEFGANGVLTTEWERYSARVHADTSMAGADADGLTSQGIITFGYTKGWFLDIPLVRDTDDDLIAYLAACPYGDTTWPGALFVRGVDGVTFDEEVGAVPAADRAAIGRALSALPSALPEVWDRASSVSVRLYGGATLTSATEAEVENGANLALIGDEMVGFTTATLVAEATYQLSGFLRGRRGTEAEVSGHAIGDRFVVLSSLPRAAMGASDVGDTFFVRADTQGGREGFPQEVDPFTGASSKPYSPAHLTVTDSSGDKVVTWVRRTRIGGAWRDYQEAMLGEGSEAYLGQILDVGGNVIRTFSGLSSPTLTYTAAQQAADGSPAGVTVRVMQVSSTVGNGYPSDALLAA